MKKMTNFLFVILVLALIATWHYRLPFIKQFMNDRGMVIVYHVEHRSELKATVIIVTRIDERLIVEVIKGPGPENVVVLKGEAAKRYLIDADLD